MAQNILARTICLLKRTEESLLLVYVALLARAYPYWDKMSWPKQLSDPSGTEKTIMTHVEIYVKIAYLACESLNTNRGIDISMHSSDYDICGEDEYRSPQVMDWDRFEPLDRSGHLDEIVS